MATALALAPEGYGPTLGRPSSIVCYSKVGSDSLSCLQKTRQHHESLLLVLVAELLAVSSLLALAPAEHVHGANGDEEGDRGTSADKDHANPGNHLKHVVGAGDELEAVAVGDLALGAAGAAQGRQVGVDAEVGDLAKEEEGQAEGVNGEVVGLGGPAKGGVDLEAGLEAGDGPVEEGVAEDVPDGHGRGRELVDKHGLVLALEEVEGDAGKGELLVPAQGPVKSVGLGHVVLEVRVHGRVEVAAHGEEERVEEQRAQVLDDEDGAPAELGAEVLDQQLRVGEGGQDGLAVLQGLLGRRVEQTDAVVVGQTDLFGDNGLGIFDGRGRGQVD